MYTSFTLTCIKEDLPLPVVDWVEDRPAEDNYPKTP